MSYILAEALLFLITLSDFVQSIFYSFLFIAKDKFAQINSNSLATFAIDSNDA